MTTTDPAMDIVPLCPDGPAPRTVLLFSRIDFAWLNPLLMQRMRERFGTRFVVVPPGPKWVEFYRPHCGPDDRLVMSEDLLTAAEAAPLDAGSVFETARRYEDAYGLVYLRDIVQQSRFHSAYYLGYAPNSPYSSRPPPPLAETTKRINHLFAHFERFFAEEEIDLVVERPGDILSTVCLTVARARGIPTTFWLPARYQSYVMWSVGPYLGSEMIRAAYDRLPEPEPIPLDDVRPPDDSKGNFAKVDVLRSKRQLLRDIYATTRDYAIWAVQDLLARRRSRRHSYGATLRHHLSVWRSHRWLAEAAESRTEALFAKPFVLFLLQFEPEYTTLSLSRQFNDTRAFVQQLALSLPSGVNLVVKENVNSVGNRDLDFYRGLIRLPNVILADHRLPGVALMAEAQAVATVSSTGALEANLFGKPSIIMAADLEFGFLPDVHRVESFAALPELCREVLRPRDEAERYRIRSRATRYRQALCSVSFQAPGTRPFRGTETTLPEGELDRAIDRLVDCLRLQRAGAPAPAGTQGGFAPAEQGVMGCK